MSVWFLSLQDNKNAEQYFSLTANHSCWDWVRRVTEREKQRVREGESTYVKPQKDEQN